MVARFYYHAFSSVGQNRLVTYTLKYKGASKDSSSDAIEEPFLVPKKNIQSRFFKEPSLANLSIIWRTFHYKEPFVKQKGSSDVKGSLWNHLDKKVLLWHREAPLFLRVYLFRWQYTVIYNIWVIYSRRRLESGIAKFSKYPHRCGDWLPHIHLKTLDSSALEPCRLTNPHKKDNSASSCNSRDGNKEAKLTDCFKILYIKYKIILQYYYFNITILLFSQYHCFTLFTDFIQKTYRPQTFKR